MKSITTTTKSFHAPLHSIFTPKFVSRNTFLFFFFAKHLLQISELPTKMVNESHEPIVFIVCPTHRWMNAARSEKKKTNLNLMNTNKQAKKYEMMRVIDNLMLYFVHM